MSYRLDLTEDTAVEVRRVVVEQIDKAIDELTDETLDRHAAVHQARKRFKKIRGVLRLVRPVLGKTYSEENTWYRDTARKLGAVRDAEAVIGTLDDLHDGFAEQMDERLYQRTREALVQRRARIAEAEKLEETVGEVVEGLRQARERVEDWPLDKRSFKLVKGGLAKTYGRGRDARKAAYKEDTPEAFHEWRKRVKYYWYHIRLLRDTWKPIHKKWRKELKKLSDYLGDDHDLAVFHELIEEEDLGLQEADGPALLALIEARRKQLEEKVAPLGRRLYAEKPKAFLRRTAAWWEAAVVDG